LEWISGEMFLDEDFQRVCVSHGGQRAPVRDLLLGGVAGIHFAWTGERVVKIRSGEAVQTGGIEVYGTG
jgi:hypothetical protein